MPAAKGSIDVKESLVTPLNFFALLMAYLAFTATKKYGPALVDKAKAALPSQK